MTDLWWRNPAGDIHEMVEVGVQNIAWDRGVLRKRRIDPGKFSDLYFGKGTKWRSLLVGDQGTAELTPEAPSVRESKILYPTWEYGLNPLHELEDWVTKNPDPSQEHLVFVTRPPPIQHIEGRRFLIYLQDLNEDSPAKIHLHGLYGFRAMFGRGFGSVDYEPKQLARMGKVVLPMGKEVLFEDAWFYYPKWVLRANMANHDLSVPRNRCIFNIRAALWAADNWNSDVELSSKQFEAVSADEFLSGVTKVEKPKRNPRPKPGDMIECNSCSLQFSCKLFRAGRLCTVPLSEGSKIAKHFKTANVEDALDGLAEIIDIDAERTARAIAVENSTDEFDPEVSKMINNLWKKGSEYVKILQPKGPLVSINNTNATLTGAAAAELTGTTDEHQLVAAAFAKLERAGWPRAEITEEVVDRVLKEREVPKYIPQLEEAEVVGDNI
jgi:hypothetical protein